MKRILITGVNSYVGNSLEKWLNQYPDQYDINKISLRDGSWKEHDFSDYDSIVHVAGIAHQKETKKNASLYYVVNRDLTDAVAKKAKNEGVKHFIFLSTMSVYGLNEGIINEHTPLKPKTHYGKSKLQAEERIKLLATDTFKVAIIRPPMIYGKGCKGNYQRLRKLALMTPVFPDIYNQRSMIYIDNLSEFLRILIDDQSKGFFFPQNKEYVCTTELVYSITKANNKKIHMTKAFNPFIKIIKISTIRKVFGDLIYAKRLISKELVNGDSFIDFDKSIKLTEE